jgi:hypothetical protein
VFLAGAGAVAAGAAGTAAARSVLTDTSVRPEGAPANAVASTVSTKTVTPRHGAGIFDVDPSQSGVSQSPSVAVTGIKSLPLDMDL